MNLASVQGHALYIGPGLDTLPIIALPSIQTWTLVELDNSSLIRAQIVERLEAINFILVHKSSKDFWQKHWSKDRVYKQSSKCFTFRLADPGRHVEIKYYFGIRFDQYLPLHEHNDLVDAIREANVFVYMGTEVDKVLWRIKNDDQQVLLIADDKTVYTSDPQDDYEVDNIFHYSNVEHTKSKISDVVMLCKQQYSQQYGEDYYDLHIFDSNTNIVQKPGVTFNDLVTRRPRSNM